MNVIPNVDQVNQSISDLQHVLIHPFHFCSDTGTQVCRILFACIEDTIISSIVKRDESVGQHVMYIIRLQHIQVPVMSMTIRWILIDRPPITHVSYNHCLCCCCCAI
jgi:hypothetical protein